MRPADALWLSELSISHLGERPLQIAQGLLVASCEHRMHVLFARCPDEPVSSLLPLPCAHDYSVLVPGVAGWRDCFVEPQPIHVRSQLEWGMWRPLEADIQQPQRPVRLRPLRSDDDWQLVKGLLQQTFLEEIVLEKLHVMRVRHRHILSMWYLVMLGSTAIGLVGLVFISAPVGIAGRVLDFFLLPEFTNQGYADAVVQGLFQEASALGMTALCLVTRAHAPLSQCFLASGFLHQCTWTRFSPFQQHKKYGGQ